MGVLERIKEIEDEMARTQKNKATEYHLGLLKGKLARLRQQLIDPEGGSGGGKGEGFEVAKSGDARVALIGFPSVGKSTLLSTMTETKSEAASYEFTTLTCIPGVIEHRGARIQLLDLPGIIEGASEGKGRGRQVIAVARSSDMVVMMLDASKGDAQREKLERELEAVGLRLNQRPADATVRPKASGGITFNATVPLTHVDEKMVQNVLKQCYKMHNADILLREDVTIDQIIDIVEGNRKYIPCVYVYNKIDCLTIEDVDELARRPNSVVASCHMGLNLDGIREAVWEKLALVRVYTKKRGEPPDFSEPVILRNQSGYLATVESICNEIHRSLKGQFRYALVWGRSTKHNPQRVGLTHVLNDEDVIQIVKK